MTIYAIIMFAVAALFAFIGVSIRGGNIKLINDQHYMRVRQEQRGAYCKAFSLGLFTMAASMAISGIVALCGDNDSLAAVALVIMVIGLAAGVAVLCIVQKKYNGGIF